jgi:hypothetical protein
MIPLHMIKALNATTELMAHKWQEGKERDNEPSLTLAHPFGGSLMIEAMAEFGNECGWSTGTNLLHLCFEANEPGVLLLAVAGLRRTVEDVLGPAIKMLGMRKYGDKELCAAMRWIAASCIGLLGARAREARPALLRRLRRERHPRVRAAVLWAFGALGGHSAADQRTLVASLLFDRCLCVQGAAEVALNADDFGCADLWFARNAKSGTGPDALGEFWKERIEPSLS